MGDFAEQFRESVRDLKGLLLQAHEEGHPDLRRFRGEGAVLEVTPVCFVRGRNGGRKEGGAGWILGGLIVKDHLFCGRRDSASRRASAGEREEHIK